MFTTTKERSSIYHHTMPTQLIDIVKYLIELDNQRSSLGPTKLHKLFYYMQVCHLIAFNKTPFFEEDFEKWENGPRLEALNTVVYKLYYSSTNSMSEGDSDRLSSTEKSFIESTYNAFLLKSESELVERFRVETPWVDTQLNEYGVITKERMWSDNRANSAVMCDLIDVIVNIVPAEVSPFVTVVAEFIRDCTNRYSLLDIYNRIMTHSHKINEKESMHAKWKGQSNTDALVCKLFLPQELLKRNISDSVHYRNYNTITRLQLCTKANNPLAKFHMYSYINILIGDMINNEELRNQNTDVYQLYEFNQALLNQSRLANITDAEDKFEAAMLFTQLSRSSIAIEALKQVKSIKTYNMLGDLLNDPKWYQESINLKPNTYAKVKIFKFNKEYEEARKLLETCSEDECPEKYILLYYLVNSENEKQGKENESVKLLELAADTLKDTHYLAIAAGKCNRIGDYSEAWRLHEKAAYRGHINSYLNLADLNKTRTTEFETKARNAGLLVYNSSFSDHSEYLNAKLKRVMAIKEFIEYGYTY
jgi:uncharacterized phage-associated protein